MRCTRKQTASKVSVIGLSTAGVCCRDSANGGKVVEADLKPGLYAFTVDADAQEFDWEDLYIVFNQYGNVNQRTGPWDFNELRENRPVMPAYWVSLDGRKLGLWYFNRLSSEQVAARRSRGELCFRVTVAGRHMLEFVPYRPFRIAWDNVELQPEPYDRLEPMLRLPSDLAGKMMPAVMPTNRFTEGFVRSIAYAKQGAKDRRFQGMRLPMLATAWRWLGDAEALAVLREGIEKHLELPAWGNPREDGYGHNGDMNAAAPLLGMALALRWVGDDLTDLRERMLARLEKQGNTFLEMAWLHRGYWGGSILQDHGFVALTWFACAAYVLHDLIPLAHDWLAFAVPRVKRSVAAMPCDGMVPNTSYHRLARYTDKVALFRELHRLATGEDILCEPALRNIPFAARACYLADAAAFVFPSPGGDLSPLNGGHSFLAQMPNDPDAQWLLDRLFEQDRLTREQKGDTERNHQSSYLEWNYQKEWLWAMLFTEIASSVPLPPAERGDVVRCGSDTAGRTMFWFRDVGVGIVRTERDIVVTHCGPPVSTTSYARATCCCDRMVIAPASGNFAYVHKGRLVFHTAEGGYRMTTDIANALMVDGRGQKGDIGMPMSYPEFKYHGEKILDVADTGVLMDLAPAYGGLAAYTRRVSLTPAGDLEIEDTVRPEGARMLCWRFQTFRHNPWAPVTRGVWRLTVDGQDYEVRLTVTGAEFADRIAETHTVFGYGNYINDQLCHHLAIETARTDKPVILRLTVAPMPSTVECLP